jgi:hypothetical protein
MNKKIIFHRYFRGLQLIWAYERKPREIEFIPFDALISLNTRLKTIHTTSWYQDEISEFNCDYKPKAIKKDNIIQITYESNPGNLYDCAPGITTIEFTNSSLSTIKNVSWLETEYSGIKILGYQYSSKINRKYSVRTRKENIVNVWDRVEQAKLKSEILTVDTKCLLSKCDLSQVLEVAHIRPVSQKGTDFLDNAILLRADLHVLFDQGLVSIHPVTGKVIYDTSIKKYAITQKLRSSIDKRVLKRIQNSLKWRQKFY